MASLTERPEIPTKPYTVRWREDDRNRRRSFARKREAEAWVTQASLIEQRAREGRREAPERMRNTKLGSWWQDWRETRYHVSLSTRKKDEWVWRRWLEPNLGHRKLGSITHHDLARILTKVTESGAGADTRIAVYQRLCMMLDDALGKDGHTCRNAKAGTSRRKRRIRLLTDDELEALLRQFDGPERLLVDTLATMGLRPGDEALKLEGADVDDGKLHVRSNKNDRQRTLPIPDHLYVPLTHLSMDVGRHGRLWKVGDYRTWRRRSFKPAAKAVGLDGLVPYDLRHTCASKLISLGATPNDVADWMGHSVNMTLTVYGHLFPGRKDELARLLGR